jgi:oligopeptide/dipeptide ABC transporter ATP-binding protein
MAAHEEELTDGSHPAGPQSSSGREPSAFLEVRDLRIHFPTDDGLVKAVDGLSFTLDRGRTLGIVGESGSGKSVTSLGILGLHKGTNARLSGEIWLDGEELVSASADRVRRLRGRKMAMIFQDPLSAMHPYYTVGAQIMEAYRIHHDASKQVARKRAIELLDRVGIPEPARRVDDYPHQFSGGMRQRAMIAMALSCNPELLIADEPTTALDVTVQAQILALLDEIRRERNTSVLFITHDFGVLAQIADRVAVMYGGRIVEQGRTAELLAHPAHPYTARLIDCVPVLGSGRREMSAIPGLPPAGDAMPAGCAFAARCDRATDTCREGVIDERDIAPAHSVRCLHPLRGEA